MWYLGKSQWDETINPDLIKNEAYGPEYVGATSASMLIPFYAKLGLRLYMVDAGSTAKAIALAHGYLAQQKPVCFTEDDPYVDTSLEKYKGWTHVCAWHEDSAGNLIAMDPYIAKDVEKADATWATLLRSTQIWIMEKTMQALPNGWHDDGKTLTAPNGVSFVLGFRAHVLPRLLSGQWEPDDVPLRPQYYTQRLEDSNTDLGDGDQIICTKSMLGYPHNPTGAVAHLKDIVIEEYLGVEFQYISNKAVQYLKQLQSGQPPAQPDPKIADLQSQVDDLQKQLEAEKAKEQEAKAAVSAAIAGLSGL